MSVIATQATQPLVSIIVPIYNVANFLAPALTSISAQTYTNLEIFLIDDGSTDNSLVIAQDFANKDARMQVLTKANGGLSDARNFGLRRATGEYVYFMDSDDIIEPTLIMTCLEQLQVNDADVAIFDYQQIDENGNPVVSEYGHGDIYKQNGVLTSDEALIGLFNQAIIITAWSYVAKRTIFTANNLTFSVGRLHEDVNTTPKVLSFANRVAVIDQALYQYRIRKGSIMATPKPKNLLDLLWVTNDLQAFMGANQTPKAVLTASYALIFANFSSYLWNVSPKFAHKHPQAYQQWLAMLSEASQHLSRQQVDIKTRVKLQSSKSLLFVALINKFKTRKYFF